MESIINFYYYINNISSSINAFICAMNFIVLIVSRQVSEVYRRVAYILALSYAVIPLRYLYGVYLNSNWFIILLNSVFCIVMIIYRGNLAMPVSKVRKL
ncbi:phage holin family protein [Vagococcus sp. WN89Y]|uniref:phage holin family protein n=1 Tax=Vagococcus sp. WN89Y TaxID=3457258 RepID=UPI003FCEBFBB